MYQKASRRDGFLMIAPLAVVVLALVAFPTAYSYFISLHRFRLASDQREFIGLDNYLNTVTSGSFLDSVWYSSKFALFATLIELVIGIALAVLLSQWQKGKGIAISLILMPMMIAPSLFALIFRLLLNDFVGVIPYYFAELGISINPFDPEWVHMTLLAIDALQWIPFVFIISYAALTTIPMELYESAKVDGAGSLQTFTRITLPLLVPTMITIAFLRGIDAFKVYDMIYVLTNGGPGELTTSVSLFIYKKAFLDGDLGEAAAASILLTFILALPLYLTTKFILRREGAHG